MDNIQSVLPMSKSLRLDENFNELWGFCLEFKTKLDIKEPKFRRIWKIPKKFDDGAQPALVIITRKNLFRDTRYCDKQLT